MQNKISTPIAAAAVAGVLIVILVIFLVVHSRPAAVPSGPSATAAYTHPGPGNHP
jgi:hypothetical protein